MNIILLGPPGVGKGTQAQQLSRVKGLPHLSTGEMLRHAVAVQSPLGLHIESTMAAGKLVPDQWVSALVRSRLAQSECQLGFILDGFPRSLKQADLLTEWGVKIDHVIVFTIVEVQLIARISGRRVHPASGRTYHVTHCPPRVADKDDITGERLILRDDDHPEVVQSRLAVYQEQILPLLEYYQQRATHGHVHYAAIDADQPIAAIHTQLVSLIA